MNSSINNIAYKFNLIYLAFVVLWPLFQISFFNGIDGAGHMGWIFMIFAVILNKKRLFNVPKVMYFWGGWVVYNLILCQIQGFYNENVSFTVWSLRNLVAPFITLLVSYNAFRCNEYKTIFFLFCIWFVYVFVGALNMQGTSEVLGDGITRQKNELGNTFVNASVFLLTFAFFAMYYKIVSKNIFVMACSLEVVTMIMSGSRKGIIAIFIIVILSYIGKNFSSNMKTYFRIGFISLVSYILINLIMTYTAAGVRILSGQESSKYQDNVFLLMMGDRGFMYDYGWQMFLDHPIVGIGLQNFRYQNPLGVDLVLHTEYIVQICECGILGSLMFFFFYWGMAKRIKRLMFIPEERQLALVLCASFVGFLFMNFFAWTYSFNHYFIIFGFIYAFYENREGIIKSN